MVPTSRPTACRERIAVSRPEPGPLTKTSTLRMPCSCARRAAASAAICAANGVDLREPLKPTWPALAHEITFPWGSVMETMVLLNVLLMCAWPCATFFFSLRRTFLAPPACCRVLGGISLSFLEVVGPVSHGTSLAHAVREARDWARADGLLLAGLLLACDRATRALAGTRVGVRALAVDREATTVAQALVTADLDLAADVGGNLAPQVALGPVVALDPVTKPDQVVLGQVPHA